MPEYIDYAEYYDYDTASMVDAPFYLDYARQCGSPILELACGTGRLLITLAEAGFDVYGIDSSENMLSVCRRKIDEKNLAPRVHPTLADMADFELERRDFALAFAAFRSFMHLYTHEDQRACLQRTFQHLRDGGYLIIDLPVKLGLGCVIDK